MFYSQFILAKKGPLGTIWIAAHLEGKLRKNHVTDTNIPASVDTILFSEVPIALRLSGHLLLGVVRIYSRKVNYLFHDCSEALVKIKDAFHYSSVDLPPEASKVPFHSITLPETFDFDALEATFKWDKVHASSGDFLVDHHVSARDLITLRDQADEEITLQDQDNEKNQRSLFHSDGGSPASSDPYSLLLDSDEEQAQENLHASGLKAPLLQEDEGPVLEEDVLPPLQLDEKMDMERENMDFMRQTEQSGPSPARLFDMGLPSSSQSDPTKGSANIASGSVFTSSQMQDFPDIEKLRSIPEQREPETFLTELEEELVPSSSKLEKTGNSKNTVDDFGPPEIEAMPVLDETPHLNRPSPSPIGDFGNYSGNEDVLGNILEGRTPTLKVASFSKEAPESAQHKRGLKKRKAVFDHNIVLSSSSMKKQIAGAADLLRPRRKMPLTQLGAWRMQGIYNNQMFARPSVPGLSSPIRELYSRITTLSAKEQSNFPTPHQGVAQPSIDEAVLGGNMMAEAETSSADNHPVDELETPAFSPLQSLHNVEKTPHVDISVKKDIERQHSARGIGEQENEGAKEPELHLYDTLPQEPDFGVAMEVDDRLFDKEVPEALATPASQSAVGAPITPLHSPSSATTPTRMLEKLDFLEDNRDKALFHSDDLDGYDHFVDESNTRYPKRAKDNQLDNGWSVRTKCVAKYLKSVFEETEPPFGSQVSLDSLLKGRTKKEAARMYFETLVLKSKDYIHVEQRSGFEEIMLSATPLLKKEIL